MSDSVARAESQRHSGRKAGIGTAKSPLIFSLISQIVVRRTNIHTKMHTCYTEAYTPRIQTKINEDQGLLAALESNELVQSENCFLIFFRLLKGFN